ncbi:MAG TPA: pyridoxamine 5'-phosphate oxidase family protein [Methylomirabilota bacterium]|jgi:PPOX class probable F420-dependent enzyme|nr:pyridoxamine 5'-phosphate oxidase family protein [Methylomirabilota bacterium]
MSFVPSDKVGSLSDGELLAFLAEPWNGRIATVSGEGWPYLTPVWYEFDPATRIFLVVGRERAAWVGHIRSDPRVAFHVADDAHAQHTRVLVQARAEIAEGPIAPSASPRLLELTRRLSRRYLGPGGPAYAERTVARPRVLVTLTPTRWTSWTGGEWHPRYR